MKFHTGRFYSGFQGQKDLGQVTCFGDRKTYRAGGVVGTHLGMDALSRLSINMGYIGGADRSFLESGGGIIAHSIIALPHPQGQY